MAKRKMFIAAALIIIIAVAFLLVFNRNTVVFSEKSNDGNIVVTIEKPFNPFSIGAMGGYEYSLVVLDKNKFVHKKAEETFWFVNDGAPLGKENVSVEWFHDRVEIIVDSEEMNAKIFSFYFSKTL